MRKALVFLFVLLIQSQSSFAESMGDFFQLHYMEWPELPDLKDIEPNSVLRDIETNAVTSEQQEMLERINAER